MLRPADLRIDYDHRQVNHDRMAAIRSRATGSVLDVGCGSGAYVERMAEERFIMGIDRAQSSAWTADRYAVADAAALPFQDKSFDTLLVFETLEHLADPLSALREYRRIARHRILLTVPNCELTAGMVASNLIYHHWVDETHRHFWDLQGIADLVTSAGFVVEDRHLINRIDPLPLLRELLRLPTRFDRVLRQVDRHWLRSYRMTSLVVARPT